MARVFIGVGSNQDSRLYHISNAIHTLGDVKGVRVAQLAPVIETEPLGGMPQGLYLNTVVEIETSLPPGELLQALKAIEHKEGRIQSAERWSPRPIDLDILLYDDKIIKQADLEVPHPRMHERRFVLEPIAQLAPNIMHPVLRESISTLLGNLPADPVKQQ